MNSQTQMLAKRFFGLLSGEVAMVVALSEYVGRPCNKEQMTVIQLTGGSSDREGNIVDTQSIT